MTTSTDLGVTRAQRVVRAQMVNPRQYGETTGVERLLLDNSLMVQTVMSTTIKPLDEIVAALPGCSRRAIIQTLASMGRHGLAVGSPEGWRLTAKAMKS